MRGATPMRALHAALLLLVLPAIVLAQEQRMLTQAFSGGSLVYDDARDRLIALQYTGGLWEWDGQRWALPLAQPPGYVTARCYDPVRRRTFAACMSVVDGRLVGRSVLCDYDGREFRQLALVPSTSIPLGIAADTVRSRIVVVAAQA